MHNYKITIQYDGTDFAGWQIQNDVPTVQSEIESALKKIFQEKIGIIGSGRTDTGVHAFGQVANFFIDKEINTYKLFNSINSLLPDSIAINELSKVEQSFHSRFDATRRSYIYFLNNFKSPFYNKYSHLYTPLNNINVSNLNLISNSLLGKHDFTSFCRKNSEVENKVCHIKSIFWRKTNGFLIMLIEADRYLHGMVKTIVGTLIKAVEQNRDEKYIDEILNAKDREVAGKAFPSKGLFLNKVRYSND